MRLQWGTGEVRHETHRGLPRFGAGIKHRVRWEEDKEPAWHYARDVHCAHTSESSAWPTRITVACGNKGACKQWPAQVAPCTSNGHNGQGLLRQLHTEVTEPVPGCRCARLPVGLASDMGAPSPSSLRRQEGSGRTKGIAQVHLVVDVAACLEAAVECCAARPPGESCHADLRRRDDVGVLQSHLKGPARRAQALAMGGGDGLGQEQLAGMAPPNAGTPAGAACAKAAL